MNLFHLTIRITKKILSTLKIFLFREILNKDPYTKLKINPVKSLKHLGSKYGGWVLPTKLFNKNSICYCGGVGEDISFALEMIKQFNCKIFAFDPTLKQ